jgi:hypothetical protein
MREDATHHYLDTALQLCTLVAAGLLLIGSVAKLRSPQSLGNTLGLVPVRVRYGAAVSVGLAELAIAVWVLIDGSRLSLAALLSVYVLFSGVNIYRLRWPGATRDCGCFGDLSSQVTWFHFGLTVVCAISVGIALLVGTHGALDAAAGRSWALRACLVLLVIAASRGVVELLSDVRYSQTPNSSVHGGR